MCLTLRIGTDSWSGVGTDPSNGGPRAHPLEGGMDLDSGRAAGGQNMKNRAAADDIAHANQTWGTAGRMDLQRLENLGMESQTESIRQA